jgi:uncharacterized protein GlcG (DUF336 family)
MEAASVAVSTCAKQGHAVSATVMDVDAVTIAQLRGDGAPVHTVEASWQKAYAAASFAPVFGQDSGSGVAGVIARYSAAAPPGTLPFQTPEHMIVRAGGITIKLGAEVMGAIGVGGAPSAQADEACARAGLDAVRDQIR